MLVDNNTQAFFSLVRSGLWEQEVQLSFFDKINFGKVLNLAEEQSVVGLVAAGLEHVIGIKVPKEDILQFVGQALQLEQRNQAMNFFIGMTLEKFHEAGIEAVLIKGQGVAQCYAKPEWRSAGDVDLLLNEENYEKGKAFLKGISETEPEEYSFNKEYITTFGGWCLELHGSLRCGLSAALNRGVDEIKSVFAIISTFVIGMLMAKRSLYQKRMRMRWLFSPISLSISIKVVLVSGRFVTGVCCFGLTKRLLI